VRVTTSRIPRSTPLGRRAGLLGMGLLFAGLNTGNNLFYLVFTVMAASELVGFIVAGRALRRLKAEVTIPRRARAGSPTRITVRLTNHSRWLPVPALRWMMKTTGGAEAEVITPALGPGATGSGTARLVPTRRGLAGLRGGGSPHGVSARPRAARRASGSHPRADAGHAGARARSSGDGGQEARRRAPARASQGLRRGADRRARVRPRRRRAADRLEGVRAHGAAHVAGPPG
jgi:hypothetical protein